MFKGTKVFDVHGHVSSPPAVRNWIVNGFSSGHVPESPLRATGSASGPFSDQAFAETNQMHADYMTERNIDVQIIGPRPFMQMGFMQRNLYTRWCEFTNDQILKQVKHAPDRFLGASLLPQIAEAPDLSNCVPEFEKNVKEYGFVGTYLSPDPDGRHNSPGMDQPYWHPVYEKCVEWDVPVFIHGTNCLDPRIGHIPGNYQVGFVVETFLATRILAYSDLFKKFPSLRICIAHAGGALDRFIASSDHKGNFKGDNLFFDTCTYDIDYLELAIKQWGVANMAFGTEAPGSGRAVRQESDHPSKTNVGKTSDDLLPVIDYLPSLSEEDKITIVNKNPLKVFPGFLKAK
jgi:predicted TIM-barrel fold metal-dependent hydrolase